MLMRLNSSKHANAPDDARPYGDEDERRKGKKRRRRIRNEGMIRGEKLNMKNSRRNNNVTLLRKGPVEGHLGM